MMEEKLFKTEIDFCSTCGTILPLPGRDPTVKCYRCKTEIDVSGTRALSLDLYK